MKSITEWIKMRSAKGIAIERGARNYYRVRVFSPLLEYHTYYFDRAGYAYDAFARIKDRLEYIRRRV